jgi:hypothetical protein
VRMRSSGDLRRGARCAGFQRPQLTPRHTPCAVHPPPPRLLAPGPP